MPCEYVYFHSRSIGRRLIIRVQIRKENQVITAEEKRAFLKTQQEEKAKREAEIVASFRERALAALPS
jgi:hypothetical protein